jgi:hypothetical protein
VFGLPGLGTLAAGHRTGYGQMVLSLAGLALTSVFGVHFVIWYVSHSTALNQLEDQAGMDLGDIWIHLRWALLGVAVFLTGWLWALASGLSILARAKAAETKPVPPLIRP